MELYPPAYQLNFDRHPQHDGYNDHHLQSQPLHDDQPIDDEPLYVNAKQYFRILKRRVARARLEEVHRLSRQRKVCFPIPSLFITSPQSHSHISTSPVINMPCAVLAVLAAVF